MNAEKIRESVNKMVDDAVIGNINALELFCELSGLEKFMKASKEIILEDAMYEREKYDEKTLEMYDCKISTGQSGRYKFDHNPVWKAANTTQKDVERNMKLAYDAFKRQEDFIDPATGEIVPVATYVPSKKFLKIG